MRYRFNIHEAGKVIHDDEGTECGSLSEALDEAKASARDVALHYIQQGLSADGPCVEVLDEEGKTVAALSVGEVLSNPYSPQFKEEC